MVKGSTAMVLSFSALAVVAVVIPVSMMVNDTRKNDVRKNDAGEKRCILVKIFTVWVPLRFGVIHFRFRQIGLNQFGFNQFGFNQGSNNFRICLAPGFFHDLSHEKTEQFCFSLAIGSGFIGIVLNNLVHYFFQF